MHLLLKLDVNLPLYVLIMIYIWHGIILWCLCTHHITRCVRQIMICRVPFTTSCQISAYSCACAQLAIFNGPAAESASARLTEMRVAFGAWDHMEPVGFTIVVSLAFR